jgi:peptide deformylase
MVRETILEGDPILRQKMPDIDDLRKARRIVNDLIDTMFGTNAIGFAANQIGEPWNICVVRLDLDSVRKKDVLVFLNPKIVHRIGSQPSVEGCKSIPDYVAIVPRSKRVLITSIPPTLKRTPYARTLIGMPAIIAQHEIDHLNGILLRDYVEGTNGKSGGVKIDKKGKSIPIGALG